jgi:ABC-type transport system substrate-binding protein
MARTDELFAPDDKTIVFRLKQPFALLPDALGHGASNMCAMMPKHIAEADPFKPALLARSWLTSAKVPRQAAGHHLVVDSRTC